MKGLFQSRKFRQGSMATAITVVVVALVVVLNFIATGLTDRYNLTVDVTPTKLFSITYETKQYLAGLEKDIKITVMDTEGSFSSRGEYYLQTVEVLKKFAQESDRISLEFVDMISNPALSQQYEEMQLSATSILVSSGDRVRHLTPSDLYDVSSDYYGNSYVTASKAEQVLTSAILGVTSDTPVNVAVITGHNEESIEAFDQMLQDNYYLTGQVNITTEEVDSIYDLAIISAPERDYTEDELRRLDTFLNNNGEYGKTLLYFSPTSQTNLPNLAAFLADWGVEIGEGIVQETDMSRIYSMWGMPDPFIASLDYAESNYSQESIAAGKVSAAAYGRPMQLLFDSKGSIYTTVLLQYAGTAGIMDAEGAFSEADAPIPHLTMSQWVNYGSEQVTASTVLACSSSAFIDTSFINNPNFSNSDYLLTLLADLTGKESDVRIQSKSVLTTSLNITAFQALVLGVLLVVVFPLAVLVSGLVIWARRRHR